MNAQPPQLSLILMASLRSTMNAHSEQCLSMRRHELGNQRSNLQPTAVIPGFVTFVLFGAVGTVVPIEFR
ncbi:hypothetical protein CPB83DRAFT_848812 [Crepidotus variabilis]|uniref:Uncharacterized protein n=1 Tax=Crepidotus variabilis TaxID=179855 RepID=A0A9P6JRW8_9AGAR|nr:hypothetical protein CPB83DRAFT_848812 [Crepidotus variabilis]